MNPVAILYVSRYCIAIFYVLLLGIVYKDLKLDNVLLDCDGPIFIAIFYFFSRYCIQRFETRQCVLRLWWSRIYSNSLFCFLVLCTEI